MHYTAPIAKIRIFYNRHHPGMDGERMYDDEPAHTDQLYEDEPAPRRSRLVPILAIIAALLWVIFIEVLSEINYWAMVGVIVVMIGVMLLPLIQTYNKGKQLRDEVGNLQDRTNFVMKAREEYINDLRKAFHVTMEG